MATIASQIMNSTTKSLQQKLKARSQGYAPFEVDNGLVTVQLTGTPHGLKGYVTYTQEVESDAEAGRSSIDAQQADAGSFLIPLDKPLKGNAEDFDTLQVLVGQLLKSPMKHFRNLDTVVRSIPPQGKRRVMAPRKGMGFKDPTDDYGLEALNIGNAAALARATTEALTGGNVGYGGGTVIGDRAAMGDTPPSNTWNREIGEGGTLPADYLRLFGLDPSSANPLIDLLPKGMIPGCGCPCGGNSEATCKCDG